MLTFPRTKLCNTKSHRLQRIVVTIDHHTHSTSCTTNMRPMHYHVPGITRDVWKEICTRQYIFSGWWMRQGGMEWQLHDDVLNDVISCAVLIFILSREHRVHWTRWNQLAQAWKSRPKDADLRNIYTSAIKACQPSKDKSLKKERLYNMHQLKSLLSQSLPSILLLNFSCKIGVRVTIV